MKTAYYTLIVRGGRPMAAGLDSGPCEGRRSVMIRQTGRRAAQDRDKVIDLNAWRADHLDEAREDGCDWGCGEAVREEERDELPGFVPRSRQNHRFMPVAELVSTLSVAAAALALILRVLTF